MVRAHLPTLSCTQSISRPGILTGIETVGDRELESRWQRQLFGIWCAIRRTSRAPRELLTAVHTNVFNLWFVLVTDFFFCNRDAELCILDEQRCDPTEARNRLWLREIIYKHNSQFLHGSWYYYYYYFIQIDFFCGTNDKHFARFGTAIRPCPLRDISVRKGVDGTASNISQNVIDPNLILIRAQ